MIDRTDDGCRYSVYLPWILKQQWLHEDTEGGERLMGGAVAAAGWTELPDESFDLAFVFGLAHPIGGTQKIRAELHRLLRSEGTLSGEGRLRPPGEHFRPVRRQGRVSRFAKVG